MIFTLTLSVPFVSKEDSEKYENYGFEFKTTEEYGTMITDKIVTIDIFAIEDLMVLVRDVGNCIISDGNIEIYNGYRE